MPSPVTLLSPAPAVAVEPVAPTPAGGPAGTFHGVLESAIQGVEASQSASDQAITGFLSGGGGELHTTILAAQRATLSFDLFLQMRNKVVSAYQEIMRMPL